MTLGSRDIKNLILFQHAFLEKTLCESHIIMCPECPNERITVSPPNLAKFGPVDQVIFACKLSSAV